MSLVGTWFGWGRASQEKYNWTELKPVPGITYNQRVRIIQLDGVALSQIGFKSTENLILFCRDEVRQLFNFLEQDILAKSGLGLICGPQGTGKSVASFAFASMLCSTQWKLTWISILRQKNTVIARLENNSIKSFSIHRDESHLLQCYLKEYCGGSENHSILIDGYIQSNQECVDIKAACHAWLDDDLINRRLVSVEILDPKKTCMKTRRIS
jgi:hypothetical protein